MRAAPIVLASILLLSVGAITFGALGQPESKQLIVAYHHDATTPRVGSAVHGAHVARAIPALGVVLVETPDPAAFANAARADPSIRYVEEDPQLLAQYSPNDPLLDHSSSKHHNLTRTRLAWDRTLGSTSIVIASIDSGLDRSHEEFATSGRILPGYDFFNNDATPEDTCGHGTRMIGVMAASTNNGKGIAGVAQVSIAPLKMGEELGAGCAGNGFAAAEAFVYAADRGMHIAHHPWGGTETGTTLKDAIRYAHGKGVLVVGPAGNYKDPCSDCVDEPWRHVANASLIVTGLDIDGDPTTRYGNGPQVDLAAPAYGIAAPEPSWSNLGKYSTNGGATSGASAIVAGIAALVKSAEPTLTAAQIEARLKSTATDLHTPGFDNLTGYGRVDAARAVWNGEPSHLPFQANFTPTASNEYWIQVRATANRPLVNVSASVDNGPWKPLQLKSYGDWAASIYAPNGSTVRFQAKASTGETNLSGCYRWTSRAPIACNTTTPPSANSSVRFTHGGGNEWWVEVKVDPKPVSAQAMDTGGAWTALSFKSWGEWAASFRIEPGHDVRFRATYPNGTTVESCWFSHPTGAAKCAAPFTANFDPSYFSSDMIMVHVTGETRTIASVNMSVNGAAWTRMAYYPPGNEWYADPAPPTSAIVQFRATSTDGAFATSPCYRYNATVDDYVTVSCNGSFDATFKNVRGNTWWIETDVSVTGGTLAGVDARVNGGTWIALTKQSYGSWAKSIHATSGSSVEFRARATDGSSDLSVVYRWPPP